jgi:hypothetical protein
MTYLPRPGHPPTSPMTQDPLSALVGFVALVIDSTPAWVLNGILGIAISRGISMRGRQ